MCEVFTGCSNTKVTGGFGRNPKPPGAVRAETALQEREDDVKTRHLHVPGKEKTEHCNSGEGLGGG